MSSSTVSQEERTAAFVTYLLTAFLGLLGALIGWAVFKDKGPFAKNQATEALNWAITLTIVFIALWIVQIALAMTVPKLALVGGLLYLVLGLGGFVLTIIGAIQVNGGTAHRFPFALRLVK